MAKYKKVKNIVVIAATMIINFQPKAVDSASLPEDDLLINESNRQNKQRKISGCYSIKFKKRENLNIKSIQYNDITTHTRFKFGVRCDEHAYV